MTLGKTQMPSSSLHTTVSVIVPTYRAERFVERCVESVLAQTFRDFELVIVDDGSTDASSERLKRFLADDSVTLLSQPNHGLSCARNTGLRLRRKTSDFVYFLDADDFIHPELLEVCVRTLRDHPSADFALLETKKCAACETPPWEALPTFAPRELTYPARKLLVPDFHYETLAVWRFFFRAESIAGVFFEPGLSYVEDLDFLFRVFRRGGHGVAIPCCLHCYAQTEQSLARSPVSAAKVHANMWLIRRLLELYRDDRPTLRQLRKRLFVKRIKVLYKEVHSSNEAIVRLFNALLQELFSERSITLTMFSWRMRWRLLPQWWKAHFHD